MVFDCSGGEAAITQATRMVRNGGWITIIRSWGDDSLFGSGIAAAPETAFGGASALGGGSELLANLGAATTPFFTQGGVLAAGATPFITEATMLSPFAPGGATAQSGMAGAYGPALANAGKVGWQMTPKDAMLLSAAVGAGQQERPMGAPVNMGNPMQRQAMMTQEQITKKWLLQNDPTTYARIYGAPQPMGA